MAKGGKNINPNLFSDKLTDEINKTIKNIVIIQYSQVTGKCPKGHKYCLNTKCWIMEEDDE
tara:strand:- start:1144 stop:1326 length:183 start_codon:yes stop_codon:yes gene_type:complete